MKKTLLSVSAALLLIAALGVTVYPMISNLVNDKYQSTILAECTNKVERLDDSVIQEAEQAAQTYNEQLQPIRYDLDAIEAAAVSYDDLLNLHGTGLIGYIEIPAIHVKLPIYHGTEEKILQCGVGHLVGSSLPIGGEGTHAVLTGHSGVAGKRLFSDLDQLTPRDVFYLHVLNKTLAYEIKEINTVLPYETELLQAVPGEDLCTLVTCTPYGVNTHRLLVRGSRIHYDNTATATVEAPTQHTAAKSTWKQNYVKGLTIGAIAAVAGTVISLFTFWLYRKWRKRNER